ncbi:autotransporter adhesin BigA [Superficieibacter electus]|uniref:Autotransporter adhesin BigA n=2 Tax=Superficieibacter electus TaxID=2022662 RepID=A0A2P5GKB4_9ENTR|nr:autotransporter adhesin BigA [Superficieibacter electus]POP44833.1 autotransporter adhesin BigA [Superficieibacter electus]
MTVSGQGKTGVIISGDSTKNTLNGGSTVTDGAVGLVITGDNTANTIAGQSTVDGATGALISGNGSQTKISGGITVRGGGTGLVVDGDNITLDNAGISDLSGEGSTGSIIYGNSAHVINDGEMTITDGATGGKITGNDAIIENLGNTTISGENSTALYVEGDGTTLTSEGTQIITDHATGTHIVGDNTSVAMTGDISVDSGGTAMIIDGNNAKVDITGKSEINGKDSRGSVINGNGAQIDNKGEMVVTNGAIGGIINGDNTNITNEGNSTVSGEGSVALDVEGNYTTIISEGTQNISDGATGIDINGDDAKAMITGDITVDSSGTAMRIDGNDAKVKITGNSTITGQGSTGTTVAGDYTRLTNEGKLDVADGGIGAKITGDHAAIDNEGDITVDGTGSTALYVDGDYALILSQGAQTIQNGAIGTYIDGNNTRIANTGDIFVDGTGSIAAIIDGNDSSLTQTGDMLVTNSATGIITYGTNSTTTNTGNVTIRDDGSTGFIVAGKDNTFKNKGDIDISLNGTGTLVSGDGAQVTLDGNINVDSVQDSNGVYHGGTGVEITGNNTTTAIDGNLTLNADYASNSMIDSSDTLSGITINGNNNQVALNGELAINMNDLSSVDDQYLDTIGLNVEGDGNSVNLAGGFNITRNTAQDYSASPIVGINIDGNSDVTLNGHSQVDLTDVLGGNTVMVNVKNGGSMVLSDSSVIDVRYNIIVNYIYTDAALLMAKGEGSSIDNQGTINSEGMMTFMRASNGAQSSNSGSITSVTNNDNFGRTSAMVASGKGSTAENNAGGDITLVSGTAPSYIGGIVTYPQAWYNNTAYGMLAYDYGAVKNDKDASISVYGAGLYGMGASKGTAVNAGDIYVDGFKQKLDENGNIIGESYWSTSHHELPSAGMIAGSDDSSSSGDATVINTGDITVHNAGYGMTAMYGGTAINQGTITLNADKGVTGVTNQLVGMAAFWGGTVVNDTTGVINIDADYGQAFYNDGTGYIINNGSINLNGANMDANDPHMGATATDKIWIPSLPGSGDSDTQTSAPGFLTTEALANYGNETLNGDLYANDWLYNETDASLTVNGELAIGSGGLENKGTLNADTINTSYSLYNRAGGSITTDRLYINGDSTFFNEGDFTGSIATNSYKQEIVNTGNMTVAEDGKSLVSGSFYFYNQEGATLTNSGNAVKGGENTIINMTRANESLTQVNSGTITATNGYSAITTANGSESPKWIWNTETGVINGINPDAPLINLGRGYNFGNEGTINIQGDNAIAINGSTTSYMVNLVNAGTINVGTEQGKAEGTNGTGLIGIKGNGNATTINNTADGVINVYADNSYAFGGKTKAIINNGEINLLCDTGCGIYAPGTTGTQNDHNGTADIAIPAAGTAPSEGNVPDAPADPNAPQQLSNYIVGTNADGSSGTLNANNLVIGDNVAVGTGFTAGTADTTVVVDNAFTGSNIQGAENITSTSVVWNAQGSTDADGNVDVTMTKNAYVDVTTDSSVDSVAQALDAGYTNNELYTSLNVGTSAELNNALKQVSGSQATTVFREARVLSNRFNMLADAAPQVKEGLAFNVVAKGDPRAELGNDTQYDMLALRQKLDLTASQNLTLEYGIARLDGDGAQNAGDNGLTGGYSQFFGLKHSMTFDNGLSWNNALRYDVHNLDSSRSVSYGDVNKTADSDTRQQYLEFRSEGAKTFTLMEDALKVTPYAGVKFRHTLEDGYKERSAGDFNLSMSAGSETAVDSVVGLKLDYAGDNGWSATAMLEGGPNLSYSKSQRNASLQGAAGQSFSVDDGQKGGGVNGLATVGVKYSSNDTTLHLDAYQWKEDNISDKGFMLNIKKTFR